MIELFIVRESTRILTLLQHQITGAKEPNKIMPFNSEDENTVTDTTPKLAVESTDSNDPVVAEASLPKVVVCFDLSTLSIQDLQAIAKDLKVPGYTSMTKEQLCETLLAL